MGKAGKMKKKGSTGEVACYITRNRAVRRLQITLADFRKLCILKGIYPREPKHRQKVQKGSGQIKTLYYKKDITYLCHEPIIWKIREQKIHMRKLRTALGKNNTETIERIKGNKPFYKVDHLVRERYPTFTDALGDLDDVLSMCFLFSTMAKTSRVQHEMIYLCKRLTVEFLHYVIEAKALRKVFISIKGYYYQVEIMGQTVTWIVPHNFTPQPPSEVDLRVMVTFTEFYLTMLGFVNYRLFQSLNLYYPPRLDGSNKVLEETTKEDDDEVNDDGIFIINERIEALNQKLKRSFIEKEDPADEQLDEKLVDATALEATRKAEQNMKKLKSLFSGCKFFLGRETNRESLTFVIRACEGEVSWDESFFPGSIYSEDDQSITHQITDRPLIEKKHLSRYYVQPQWVYDCINGRLHLPIQEYFPGVTLPPHLSPFVEISDHAYMPPEKERLIALQEGKQPQKIDEEQDSESDDDDDDDDDNEEGNNNEEPEELIEGDSDDEEEDEEDDDALADEIDTMNNYQDKEKEEEEETESKKDRLDNMGVARGKAARVNPEAQKKKEEKDELRMRAFMVPRKHRRLYRTLKKKEGLQDKRNTMLTNKRKDYENEKKAIKKNKS